MVFVFVVMMIIKKKWIKPDKNHLSHWVFLGPAEAPYRKLLVADLTVNANGFVPFFFSYIRHYT